MMTLYGVRVRNDGQTEDFEYRIEPPPAGGKCYYMPQSVERIERIVSDAERILNTASGQVVWTQNKGMIARTKGGLLGFVMQPGDRLEER